MKVYVATRSDAEGIAKAREAYVLLEEAGHTITMKWPDAVEKHRAIGISDDLAVDREVLKAQAALAMDAVCDARALIYIEPADKSEGAAGEMTAGLVHAQFRGTPVTIFVGKKSPRCLFGLLCRHHVETIEEAVAIVNALAGNKYL